MYNFKLNLTALLCVLTALSLHCQPTDNQIAKLQQRVWENLREVPGSLGDFSSMVNLSIVDGDIADAKCTILFPKSSWDLASIVADPKLTKLHQYQEVLKKTNPKIFGVFYQLITDTEALASEININGLWRPFVGTDVHLEGRGMDIGYIRSSKGSGVIFNSAIEASESAYGAVVRKSLTSNFPLINQYLCPWFMCNLPGNCTVNTGQTKNEKTHKNHLHLTLNP